MRSTIVVTPPAAEPVTLSEMKVHLRLDGSDEDALVTSLIVAVRQRFEEELGRALVTQTRELVLDEAPGRCVYLPYPPLQSVTSIKFIDSEGNETTVDSDKYLVETSSTPGRVVLKFVESWPNVQLREVAGVRIRYTAGYGAASAVPDLIKALLKAHVATLFENRENVLVAQGVTVLELPSTLKTALMQYRVAWRF